MDIDTLLKDLGPVNSQPLAQAILAQDEASWHVEELRQKKYREVHYNTQSLILVFCDHDQWPQIDVVKGAFWQALSHIAVPLMHEIIELAYPKGGTIIRAMAAKLKAGTTIAPHQDNHASFRRSHRIHIPITTNNLVRFMIDGRPHRLLVGNAYEINNQKRHSVINRGKEDRITFIFDYVPGEKE